MSFDALEGPRQTVLLAGGRAIQLRSDGVSHPSSILGGTQVHTPYEEITHLETSRRWLFMGTLRSVYLWPRRAFADPAAPEAVVQGVLAVLANRQGGEDQLAAMDAIAARVRGAPARLATPLLVAGCLLAFALEVSAGNVFEAGSFSRALFLDGDVWRLLAANLVHWDGAHLGWNLVLVTLLGLLVERSLGPGRTVLVLFGSGSGGMLLAGLVDPGAVAGSSGLAFGLAGALVWLELNRARELQARARIPRRWLYFFLLLNAAGLLLFPIARGTVHLGGFAGGVAGAMLAAGPRRLPTPGWREALGAAAALAFALSLLRAGWDAGADPNFRWRHARRLAALSDVAPLDLNNLAWKIAIAPQATRREIEAALPLAERAVAETGRRLAPLLDTLAEVQFQLGHIDDALVSIDAAIAAPCDPTLYALLASRDDACDVYLAYYREQRERFLGRRVPDERPTAPLDRPPRDPAPDAVAI